MITDSLGLASRKAKTLLMRSRKYFVPVREIGNALCTRMRPSLEGSSGFSGWTRISRKRTPLLSWSLTPTAWQRTDGRAVWWVGEL